MTKISEMGRLFRRLMISLGVIGLIAFLLRDQLPAVVDNIQNVSWPVFLAAWLGFSGVIICNARRLGLFMDSLGIHVLVRRVCYFSLLGLFVNSFSPSSLGGETLKAFCLYRVSSKRHEVFGLVVLDRFFGLLCLIGLSCTVLLLPGQDSLPASIRYVTYLMLLVSVLLTVLFSCRGAAAVIERVLRGLLPPGVSGRLMTIYRSMRLLDYPVPVLVKALGFSLGAQLFYVLNHYLLARSLGAELPLAFFIFFVPVNAILSLAPSINGLGIREGAYLFFATEYLSVDIALSLSLLITLTLTLSGAAGGLIFACFGFEGERNLEGIKPSK